MAAVRSNETNNAGPLQENAVRRVPAFAAGTHLVVVVLASTTPYSVTKGAKQITSVVHSTSSVKVYVNSILQKKNHKSYIWKWKVKQAVCSEELPEDL